jgi:ATP-dependent DNA helicase RecG
MPVKNGLFEDLDSKKIKDYLNLRAPYLKDASEDKIKEILLNLDFLTNGIGRIVPTYAGVLCLGSFPQRFLPQAVIKAAFFQGNKKEDIILDRALIEGSLLDLIDQGESFVKKNMRIARISREDKKIDLPQYSLKAVREALANALIHRDYTVEGRETTLLIFEDRLEIENPGGLGGGLKKEDLGKRRWSRNPILTRYLYEMGQVEALGRGIEMMKKETELLNAPLPQFEIDKESFKVIFRPAKV